MGWWRETIDIVKENDPAARNSLEVLLTYPGVKALAAHRQIGRASCRERVFTFV